MLALGALIILAIVIFLFLSQNSLAGKELVIVTSHYKEDLEWLKDAPYKVIVCDKAGSNPSPFSPDARCSMDVNRGREASSFLKFIIEYYDELPKYVAFIHGHEDAIHHNHPYILMDAISRAKKENHDYISLNNILQVSGLSENPTFKRHPVDDKTFSVQPPARPTHELMKEIWPEYFQPILGIEFPTDLRYQCCAQFIVSREAIRRHPKAVYEKFYNFVMDPNLDDYLTATTMEFTWHMIFGSKPDICDNDGDVLCDECTNSSYLRSRFRTL